MKTKSGPKKSAKHPTFKEEEEEEEEGIERKFLKLIISIRKPHLPHSLIENPRNEE